ncbi:MAG: ABC transporter ATP-binding protein [Hyphomicrobiaceae bacterium]
MEPILSIRDLRISIPTDEGKAQILDHVNVELPQGKIVGVVGESGCGKSTLIRAILGIMPKQTVIESGSILFRGRDLLTLSQREMTHEIRGRLIGFIPQDPYLALNPVFKVGKQLLEILRCHGLPNETAPKRIDKQTMARYRGHLIDTLRAVQVPDPELVLERYPHQFSGGQRQRILIAAALACRPEVILADEPTTALDVTTQLQILKLLKNLAGEFDVSMLFITHDFGVVAQLCDDVSVMYAGQTVEAGPTRAILDESRHPYTELLIGCHPDRASDISGISGQVPSPLAPPAGCRFHPRCPKVMKGCSLARPVPRPVGGSGHDAACLLYDKGPVAP